MSFNDYTNSASRMSPGSFKGSGAESFLGSKKDIDDLLDYAVSQSNKVFDEIDRRSKKSFKTEKSLTKKQLDDFVKENLSASAQVKKAWEKTKLGGFLGSWKDYKTALSKLGTATGKQRKEIANQAITSANKMSDILSSAIKKAGDFVVKQYTEYARSYEQSLKSTSTNLGTNRAGYTDLLQSTNKQIYDQGLSFTTSMKDVMTQMDRLAKDGIASNLESLSTLQSIASKISTTFDPTSVYDQMRRHGNDSGIYELSLGSEAMLRDALQSQFGDSQYISNGMFASTKKMVQSLLMVQDSAGKSAEYEYAIQAGIGTLVEQGMSNESAQTIQKVLSDLANKGYTDNTAGLMAMQKAGINPAVFANGTATASDWNKLITKGFGGIFQQFQTDSTLGAGAISGALGLGTSDFMGNFAETLDKIGVELEDAESIYDYLDKQKKEASKRVTFQENVENQLTNIVGLLGGNSLSQAGSSIIGGIGGLLAGGLSLAAGSSLKSFLGKGLLSGGSGAGAASGMLKGAGLKGLGLTTKTGWKGLSTVGKVANAAGGILSVVEGGFNAAGAVKNKTYSDNDIANGFGGFFMGNQSGDESAGGYLKAAGGQALSGAAAGAALGSIIPGIGTAIGAIVGGIGGAILGGVGNKIAADKKKEVTQQRSAQGAASNTSTSDYANLLSTINNSINIQTDKLVAVLTNFYKMVDSKFVANSQGVRAGDYIK